MLDTEAPKRSIHDLLAAIIPRARPTFQSPSCDYQSRSCASLVNAREQNEETHDRKRVKSKPEKMTPGNESR
jgi:hypothetical protein